MNRIIQLTQQEYDDLCENAKYKQLGAAEIEKRAIEIYNERKFCEITVAISNKEYADILKLECIASADKEFTGKEIDFIVNSDKDKIREEIDAVIQNLFETKYNVLLAKIKRFKDGEIKRVTFVQIAFLTLFAVG